MPYIRHPWYPQSAYMFRRGRLHAPVPDAMGSDDDFTYGSFTSKTPYAFKPRHTGLEGFGADAAAPGCGISDLVDKAMSGFPTGVKVSLPIVGSTTVPLTPIVALAKTEIYKVLNAGLTALAQQADKGAGYLAGVIASKVSTPLLQALLSSSSLPSAVKTAGAAVLSGPLDNALKSAFYSVGAAIAACAGKPAEPPSMAWIEAGTPTATGTTLTTVDEAVLTPMSILPLFNTTEQMNYQSQVYRQNEPLMAAIRSGQVQVTKATGTTTAAATSGAGIAVLGGAALLALLLLR